MNGTQPWYLSRGVWGSVIALVAGVAGIWNIEIDVEHTTEIVVSLASAVGGAIAGWGRIFAKKEIG